MQEIWVPTLGWEDPLKRGKAIHSSNSGLENSMDCTVHGVTKSRTRLSDFHSEQHEMDKRAVRPVGSKPDPQYLGMHSPPSSASWTLLTFSWEERNTQYLALCCLLEACRICVTCQAIKKLQTISDIRETNWLFAQESTNFKNLQANTPTYRWPVGTAGSEVILKFTFAFLVSYPTKSTPQW